MKVRIKTIEYYLPPHTEDGAVLKKDNEDWRIGEIENKTGIQIRHIADPDQTASDMGYLASEKLFKYGVNKEEIDLLVLITQSADYVLPASACVLQNRLGLRKSCMAFDINLGCSGFVYGLSIAGALIETGLIKKALLICSDTYTKYIEKNDRTCRPLFGDGASATLIEESSFDGLGPFEFGTDGSGFRDLIVPAGGSRISDGQNQKKTLFMDGSKVFMFTMDMVPQCVEELLKKANKRIKDIDLFIFHQASKIVTDNLIRRLQLPEEKVFINCGQIGNTVSASIPIAFKDAIEAKRLKEGDLVMLVGFGVGYSWGSCLVHWREES